MSPAPSTIHQIVKGNLYFELRKFIANKKIGAIIDAPTDVILSETNIVQPDIFVIFKENAGIITDLNIKGAPDLVVEVASPSTGYYDLLAKKELYQKFGIREYWLVDPQKQRVEIYWNLDQEFQLHLRRENKGTLESKILAGFEIELETIFKLEYA